MLGDLRIRPEKGTLFEDARRKRIMENLEKHARMLVSYPVRIEELFGGF